MNNNEALKLAIGELVLQKMSSGNDIPVSRCTITNTEIHALSNDVKKETQATDWIDWNGGKQPVSDTTKVQIEFLCGHIGTYFADLVSWRHQTGDYPYNIIRHRIAKEQL